jgi:hypothetical protein
MSSENQDLQNLIYQLSKETKAHETKDYIGHCVVCRKVVERKLMTYKKNHLFHPNCFHHHGNEYQATTNLMIQENSDKIDLVQLKNLQIRISNQNLTKKLSSQKRKSSKPKRKASRKFSVKRRRPKRRTSRRKVKRSSKKRKAKRRR